MKKKKNLVLAAVLFLIFIITGCQATPEKEVVIGKNDAQRLESNNNKTESPVDSATENSNSLSPLYDLLGSPVRWTVEDGKININNGRMLLKVDASVSLPQTEKVPVASASLRHFNQSDIDIVFRAFFGDDAECYEYVAQTKESIEESILSIKQELSSLSDDNTTNHSEQLNQRLMELEEDYSSAPSEKDMEKVSPILHNGLYDANSNEYEGMAVTVKTDNQRYLFEAANDCYGYLTYIRITDGHGSFLKTFPCVPYDVDISKEDASKIASELIAQITDEYELCYVGSAVKEDQDRPVSWGWCCIFMREINNVPTAYASNEIGESIENMTDMPVGYEKIAVIVNDDGICEFFWQSPMNINAIENDNVSMLSFNEVEELALDYLSNDYSEQNESYEHFTVTVDKVSFGLMRIKQQNSGAYLYVPVWNIFSEMISGKLQGEKTENFETQLAYDQTGQPTYAADSFPEVWNPITINAMDGSRIDRSLGY